MTERYFVSYFGNFGEGVGVHSTVVVTKGGLETAEHIEELTVYLTEKAGYPVTILSLYHMCTVKIECSVCGQPAASEICPQCGQPLCSGCFEAGFCANCSSQEEDWFGEHCADR